MVDNERLLYRTLLLPNLAYCHLVRHFCKMPDRRKLDTDVQG